MRARHFFEGALVAVLFTSTCTGPRAAFPPTPSAHVRPQCGSWGVVDSPSSQGDGLQSVDVVAPNDAWAVGHRTGETPGPWIVRLDPSGWRTMQYPRDGGVPDGVSALSDLDVWMVGERILHYDGRGWVVSRPPAPASDWGVSVSGVAALATGDVWAVGTSIRQEGTTRALVVHWNGTKWTMIETPATTSEWSSELSSVSARSPRDVWAVGIRSSVEPGVGDSTLAMHWDGSRWSVVPTPDVGAGWFYDVATFGKSGAWAVGTGAHGAIIERWEGSAWRVTLDSRRPADLHGVTAMSPTDAWAVGGDVALHWDGRVWTPIETPVQGAWLLDVAASARDVWAVGLRPPRGGGGSLAEHYC